MLRRGPAGAGLPRFAATSEAFELVGVVNGKHVTLYLDRAPDNSPVNGAQLQVELGGAKLEVKPHGEGEFEATLAQDLKPGVIPVTATVVIGAESDLLAGDLDLHSTAHEAHAHRGWRAYVTWIGAGIVGARAPALDRAVACRAFTADGRPMTFMRFIAALLVGLLHVACARGG